ncbi:metallophosphoesterase family protein [Corynebacterium sp. 335C]
MADAGAEPSAPVRTLWAVSDLHVAVRANRPVVAELAPRHPRDWLIVAGDVAERPELVLRTLGELADRFERVIWTPGNHEMFCRGTDRHTGEDRYRQLVDGARALGVVTPEDPYPEFAGVTICPLFTLYDYTWRPVGLSVDEAVAAAADAGVMMTDEFAIRPFEEPAAWCRRRLAETVRRLSHVRAPVILVNHWPLVREALEGLAAPQLALWAGTRHTQHWPERYGAVAVVYGHLHMPRDFTVAGVRHVEVSLGYPREWQRHPEDRAWPVPVLEDR